MSVRDDLGGTDGGTHLPPIDASAGTVVVPNAELLFAATYTQVGADLLLTGGDGTTLVIANYFAQATPPLLFSPEGAAMAPHVVATLVASQTPRQYAQLGQVELEQPIGQVEGATGTVTVMRDGVPVQLAVGDPIFQNDVVQTGVASELVIGFADGTIFTLASNARMTLDGMIYDPSAFGNSLVLSIVQGTFSFVTGQIAPTGEMLVDTPVATIGIRGTTVLCNLFAPNGPISCIASATTGDATNDVTYEDPATGAILALLSSATSFFEIERLGGLPLERPATGQELQFFQAQSNALRSAQGNFQFNFSTDQPINQPSDRTQQRGEADETGESDLAQAGGPLVTGAGGAPDSGGIGGIDTPEFGQDDLRQEPPTTSNSPTPTTTSPPPSTSTGSVPTPGGTDGGGGGEETTPTTNVAPQILTNTLTVTEGGSVVLTSADLSAIDPDSSPAILVFTVTGVTGGSFELVSSPGTPITSFTQAQVNAGAVRFVHNGGEAPPSYTVSVSDGLSATPEQTAAVIFADVNDAPVVDLNGAAGGTGFATTFTEGSGGGSGEPITIGFQNAVSGPSFTDGDVTFTNTATNQISFSNSPNQTLAIVSSGAGSVFRADIQGGARQVSVDLGDFNADPDRLFLEIFDASGNSLGRTTFDISAAFVGMQTLSLVAPSGQTIDHALFGVTGEIGFGGIYADNFTYSQSGGSVLIAGADAIVADVDSATLASVTVRLTNPQDGAAEVLRVDAGLAESLGIGVAGQGTATLTLSGAAGPADYQQLLRTATYENTSSDPTAGARTIEVQADDGGAVNNLSQIAVSTITVIPSNDAPVDFDIAATANFVADIAGTGLSFAPGVLPGATSFDNAPGSDLSLDDDDTLSVPLSFSFTFQDVTYTDITVSSNGFIWLGTAVTDDDCCDADVDEFLADPPRIAPAWYDLDPGEPGASVSFADLGDRAVITWRNVPEFSNEDGNTFQAVLFADGRIAFNYLTLNSELSGDGHFHDAIIGITAGGEAVNPGESDLSVPGTVDTGAEGTVFEFFGRDATDGEDNFDLSGQSILFTPNGSGGWSVTSSAGAAPAGFLYEFQVGEADIVADNLHGTDPEDGVTTQFTITDLPRDGGGNVVGFLLIDRGGDGTIDAVLSAADLGTAAADVQSGDSVFYFLSENDFEATPESVAFTYRTVDSDGAFSDGATVTVDFGNAPPRAVDDTATTDEDTPVVINVLANDSDPDGDALVDFFVTQPSNGSVAINPDRTLTYTPDPDFFGEDSFTYSISDRGEGQPVTAMVNVTVNPVNDAPVVDLNGEGVGTGFATAFFEGGAPVLIAPQGLVLDIDSPELVEVTVRIANVQDGLAEQLTVTLFGGVGGSVFADGSLILTGPASLQAFQDTLRTVTYVNNSQNPTPGERFIEVLANDGADENNLSSVATATVQVIAVNDIPQLVNNNLFIDEGGSVVYNNFNLSAIDADDPDADLLFTVSNVQNGQFELVSNPGVAITSFTQGQIAASDVRFVHDGGEDAPDYDFTISDGQATSPPPGSPAFPAFPANVQFTNVNDAPVVDLNGVPGGIDFAANFAAGDGEVNIADATATVLDVDSATLASLTLTLTGVQDGANETLNVLQEVLNAQNVIATGNGTATLTLTGDVSPAAYQEVLRAVTYQNTAASPTFGARTIQVEASDGALTNVPVATTTITVVEPLNDVIQTETQLIVGNTGFGTFTIEGGITETFADVTVGNASTAVGDLEVTGSETQLNVTQSTSLVVGAAGFGSLTIDDSAEVFVGAPGSDAFMTIGQAPTGVGIVTVSNADLTVNGSGGLTVGQSGMGVLDVDGGGRATTTFLTIAQNAASFGFVSVAGGSQATVISDAPEVVVGDAGDGSLSVSGNSSFTIEGVNGPFPGMVIGGSDGSGGTGTGFVTVTGAESTLSLQGDTPFIEVGNDSVGTLNVEDGTVNAGTFMLIGRQPDGVGTVNLSGGTARINLNGTASAAAAAVSPNVDEGQGAFLNVGPLGAGTLNISGGAEFIIGLGEQLADGRTAGFNVGGGGSIGGGGTGALNVDGPGSTLSVDATHVFASVGRAGMGELNITNGGVVQILGTEQSTFSVGHVPGAVGRVVVDGVDATTGARSTLTVGTASNVDPSLIVGRNGEGHLTVSGGALLEAFNLQAGARPGANNSIDDLAILPGDGGRGTIVATGAGTVVHLSNAFGTFSGLDLNEAGFLRVGRNDGDVGELHVLDGARVEITGNPNDPSKAGPGLQLARNPGSQGTVVVDNATIDIFQIGPADPFEGGPFLQVGRGGEGRLTIRNDGVVKLTGDSSFVAVSRGNVSDGANPNVQLAQSVLTVERGGDLIVDGAGPGNFAGMVIGGQKNANGAAVVTGAGSTIQITGAGANLTVGGEGDGTLGIYHGGVVSILGETGTDAFAAIANAGGSSGSVTVHGPGSQLIVGGFLVVGNGFFFDNNTPDNLNDDFGVDGVPTTGTLDILGGATVSVANGMQIGLDADATGSVLVRGASKLDATGFLSVGDGQGGQGTLTIQNGGTVDADGISIGPNGKLNAGKGSIDLGGNTLNNNGGELSLGQAPGFLLIDGDYSQTADGALDVRLGHGGTAVEVSGTANFTASQTINVNRISGPDGARFGDTATLAAALGAFIGDVPLALEDIGVNQPAGDGLRVERVDFGNEFQFTVVRTNTVRDDNAFAGDISETDTDKLLTADFQNANVTVDSTAGNDGLLAINGDLFRTDDPPDTSIAVRGQGNSVLAFNGDAEAAFVNIDQTGEGTSTLIVGSFGLMGIENSVIVGDAGTGLAEMFVHGFLSTPDLIIGNQPGSKGRVTVDGGDVAVTGTDALLVGNEGAGELIVQRGGVVSDAGDLFIASASGSSGSVTVMDDGSQLNVGGFLLIGMDFDGIPLGPNTGGMGTLTIGDFGVVNAGQVFIGTDGTLGGTGLLSAAETTLDGGTIAPGASAGTLSIDSSLVVNGGVLDIELGGTNAGESDLIDVFGFTEFFGGLLDFTLIDGYEPQAGGQIVVLNSGVGLAGDAGDVSFAVFGITADFQFDVVFGANDVRFVAVNNAVAGDSVIFHGGNLADVFAGGDGDDLLFGGGGRDELTGGAGLDTFGFAAGDGGGTIALADLITDFKDGADIIRIEGGLTFNDLNVFRDPGTDANTVVSIAETNEFLAVVQVDTGNLLDENDFMFV